MRSGVECLEFEERERERERDGVGSLWRTELGENKEEEEEEELVFFCFLNFAVMVFFYWK